MKFLCCDRKCIFSWFSGFFALPAIGHFIRSIFGFSASVGGYAIPRWFSVVACVVFSVISITFCMLAHRNETKC